MRKSSVPGTFVLGVMFIFLGGPASGSDEGLSKGAAAFLNFSPGARTIGMGGAQAAIKPQDNSSLHANPATLVFLPGQNFSATSSTIIMMEQSQEVHRTLIAR